MKTIALAGNPNCGKTSLFNALTGEVQYVGNWPGVTVEKKEGYLKGYGRRYKLIDLPGTYSLVPTSPEERAALHFLRKNPPDLILNVVDASNLSRNLYLTTQLLELGIPVLIAFNMMDVVEKRGEGIDIERLCAALGTDGIAVSATAKRGLGHLVCRMTAMCNGGVKPTRIIPEFPQSDEEKCIIRRYEWINELVRSARIEPVHTVSITDKLDGVLLHRFFALPVFFAVMLMVYLLSIRVVGEYSADFTGWLVSDFWGGGMRLILRSLSVEDWLVALLCDGMIAGVGSVLTFVPQLAVLFLLISFLEDCGYMARVAFMLDRVFYAIGLSGKSSISLVLGTGCSVPGIMACRTIENERERHLTAALTPFVPCSAKLPVFALMAGSLFPQQAFVAPSMYLWGIAAVVGSGVLWRYAGSKSDDTAYLMELPDYRMPTLRNLLRHTAERVRTFVAKAGTVILVASALIWFLQSFDLTLHMTNHAADSILATVGRFVSPMLSPLGFGFWQAAVACIASVAAKENIVATFGILLGQEGRTLTAAVGELFSPASAYSFMIFVLLSPPCAGAIGALRKELGSWRKTLPVLIYQTGLAWCAAFAVYRILQ